MVRKEIGYTTHLTSVFQTFIIASCLPSFLSSFSSFGHWEFFMFVPASFDKLPALWNYCFLFLTFWHKKKSFSFFPLQFWQKKGWIWTSCEELVGFTCRECGDFCPHFRWWKLLQNAQTYFSSGSWCFRLIFSVYHLLLRSDYVPTLYMVLEIEWRGGQSMKYEEWDVDKWD